MSRSRVRSAKPLVTKEARSGRFVAADSRGRTAKQAHVVLGARGQAVADALAESSRLRPRRPTGKTLSTTAQVARYLQEHLGQKLAAVAVGAHDPKTVSRWAAGKVSPPFVREIRLRAAYDATRLIVDQDGDETARAWFLGASPFLDYESPALVLSQAKTVQECRGIVPAAISFLEDAY
jgi:hypothetical protein